jgi:hypothetical protein
MERVGKNDPRVLGGHAANQPVYLQQLDPRRSDVSSAQGAPSGCGAIASRQKRAEHRLDPAFKQAIAYGRQVVDGVRNGQRGICQIVCASQDRAEAGLHW